MERIVYELKEFIKHVPVRDRPDYLLNNIFESCPGPFKMTDFTSFESGFGPEFMEHCEFRLYRHLLSNFPYAAELLCSALRGWNVCEFKWFTVFVECKRMSGEMVTSLGNGFSNLCIAMAACRGDPRDLRIVVEGDDGLMYHPNGFDEQFYEDCGFTIKVETAPSVYEASFCGLMMSDDGCTMTDPRKVLLNFGWSHSPMMFGGSKVRAGLLRAKAMSLLYEHPRCPILSVLARRVLDLTSSVNPRYSEGWYDRIRETEAEENMNWAMMEHAKGISQSARFAFERAYEVPIFIQLEAEDYLQECGLHKISAPWVDFLFGSDNVYQDYYYNNVSPRSGL
jgi:hypothetical protein